MPALYMHAFIACAAFKFQNQNWKQRIHWQKSWTAVKSVKFFANYICNLPKKSLYFGTQCKIA